MSVGIAYPHIESTAGSPARLQRVPRIRVAQIAMDYLAHGWSAQEMCRQHPSLKPAEIHAALGYYFDHQDEIDAEIEAEVQELNRSVGKTESAFLAKKSIKRNSLNARTVVHGCACTTGNHRRVNVVERIPYPSRSI